MSGDTDYYYFLIAGFGLIKFKEKKLLWFYVYLFYLKIKVYVF